MTSRKYTSPGLALPMTLIAVAGLTLLLIGLLTVLALERKTSRSYSDATRADLAIESGLATALSTLTEIAERDDSIVFRLEDPTTPTVPTPDRPLSPRQQFFTYGAIHENGSWRGLPLFSDSPEIPLGTTQIDAQLLTPALTTYAQTSTQLGRLTTHDHSIPRAKWVNVPSIDPKGYNLRYAFWVEDLSGRIDGKNAASQPRLLGKSTSEIPLFSFFAETPGPQQPTLVSKRTTLRTPGSIRQLISPPDAQLIEPFIDYSYLPPTTPTPKIVPYGFGYPDQGKITRDLNEFVSPPDLTGLTSYINRNLPNFQARKGAFRTSHNYVKTLAASIIDYADTDSDPTAAADHRGIDSFPFVNKIFDRYQWLNPGPTATNIQIRMDTYIELWNPSNQNATGQASLKITNPVRASIPFVSGQPFTPLHPTYTIGALTLTPNQHRVINVGATTYTFPRGAFAPAEILLSGSTETARISDANYSLLWRSSPTAPFVEIDTALGGSQRQPNRLTSNPSDRYNWKGAASPNLNTANSQFGDPRASLYIAEFHFSNTYATNAAWGGRAAKVTGPAGARNALVSLWPDRGSNTSKGVVAGNDRNLPGPTGILSPTGAIIAPYPAAQPSRAPAVISNTGRYQSLGELGHIFDPAQWANLSRPTSSPSAIAGGGISLAIGRPEYHPFDQAGRRAAQLLDLFSVKPATPLTPARKVNLNTAPPEVLRSLMAGLTLLEDTNVGPIHPPKTSRIGDTFSRYVIAHRNIFPLRAPSDLNLLRTSPQLARNHTSPADDTFFGSPNLYPADARPPDASPTFEPPVWSDAGREELLRKTLDLVTFTSKAFRIIVAGETRSPSGALLGRKNREFHYTIEPQRDATGLPIVNGQVKLTKLYERDL